MEHCIGILWVWYNARYIIVRQLCVFDSTNNEKSNDICLLNFNNFVSEISK